MLSNFHTHTVFCDGDNTAEEMVLSAIEKGFDALGFSGHGYTDFDLSYCIKDTEGYMAEINRLKEKYKKDIEIYLGLEEDAYCPCDRSQFDYIIGSCHYAKVQGKHYAIDSGAEYFRTCLELFGGDPVALAENYYGYFVDYILKRKPDIVGHFDLITKFDELGESIFLSNPQYNALAEKYIEKAARSGCIFEVNTGAISRGVRTSPYPAVNLLRVLKRENAPITLSADTHNKDTIDCAFEETRHMLYDLGFRQICSLKGGEWKQFPIL